MNEGVLYRNTLDTLTAYPAHVKALVDVAENWTLIYRLDATTVYSLQDRGLLCDEWQRIGKAVKLNREFLEVDPLTDYGRAFVNWYTRLRDVPQQLELFGSDV